MCGNETGDFAGEKSEIDWRRSEPAGIPLMCDSRSTPGGIVAEVEEVEVEVDEEVEEEAAGAVDVVVKEVN